jgi:hypothetical protein
MAHEQMIKRVCEIVQNKKEKVNGWLKFDVPVAGQVDLKNGRIFVDHIGIGGTVVCDSYTLGESSTSFHTRCHSYGIQLSDPKNCIKNPKQCTSVPTTSDIIGLFDNSIKIGGPVWDVLISDYGLTIYGPNENLNNQLTEWAKVYRTGTEERLMAKYIQKNMSEIINQLQYSSNPVDHPEYYEDVILPSVGFTVKYFKL